MVLIRCHEKVTLFTDILSILLARCFNRYCHKKSQIYLSPYHAKTSSTHSYFIDRNLAVVGETVCWASELRYLLALKVVYLRTRPS